MGYAMERDDTNTNFVFMMSIEFEKFELGEF